MRKILRLSKVGLPENKIMKKLNRILITTLLLLPYSVFLQPSLNKCGEIEDLTNDAKFEKAKKCKKEIDVKYVKPLQILPQTQTKFEVVTISEKKCKDFKNSSVMWVVLLSELQSIYREKILEFGQTENRLKKLIGLSNDTYNCLAVLRVSSEMLRRPIQSDDDPNYPFTGLGFTCDWYYGDGCRYGLSEFILIKKAELISKYEIGNCTIENLPNAKCPTIH